MKRPLGFTLVELVVVVALASVLLALAAPAFINQLAKGRADGVVSELVTDLQYARSEAVQRNAPVRVYVASNCYSILVAGSTAPTSCSSLGTGAIPLKQVTLDGTRATLAFTPAGTNAYFEFDPVRGMALDAAGADASGYVDVTSAAGNWLWRAVVFKLGRVKTCAPTGTVVGLTTDCS